MSVSTVIGNLTSLNLTMGTYELSQMIDVRHDHFKRSVERLFEQGILTPPMGESDIPSNRGRIIKEYRLNKRDSIVAIAQNSPEFTAVLVDRWDELERENKILLQGHQDILNLSEDSTVEDAKEISKVTLDIRKNMLEGYSGFSKSVRDAFLSGSSKPGKTVQQAQINYARMVTKVATGTHLEAFKKAHDGMNPRNWFTKEDRPDMLLRIREIEIMISTLVDMKFSYEQVKQHLFEKFSVPS